MKTCVRCETDKPIQEFYRARHAADGLQAWCKPCMRAANEAVRRRQGAQPRLAMPAPLEVRFWRYVEPEPNSGCWLWVGAQDGHGYGSIGLTETQRMTKAHRASWRLHRGEIPAGLDIDHLCRNRQCVNPAHLEPVTRRVNLLRGIASRCA